MSLEQRLAEMTEALNANTALLAIITERGKGNVSAASADKPKDDKPAKPAKPARTTKAAKEKLPTIAAMKAMAEKYLNVEDEDEYQERRANVRAITDYCGGETFSKLEGEARLTASKLLDYASQADDFDPEDVQSAVDTLIASGHLADPEANEKPKTTRSRRNDDV